jgi:TrmH family RNA methyltransferase
MPITKSQVKYIQSLGHKKFRDEEGVFVVEGSKTVGELLNAPNMRPFRIFAVKEWVAQERDERRSGRPAAGDRVSGQAPAGNRVSRQVPPGELLVEVSASELERISSLSTPNQVLAVFEKPSFPPPVFTGAFSLLLDGIQDPGNLGTIIRIADWFGLSQVFCSRDSADVFNGKVVQSTMGSISRVQVLYGDPGDLIRKHPALPIYAAVLEGQSLYKQPRVREGFLLIGNESKGIRPELLERATHAITIPRIGQAESLNAGVATGIILSHLVYFEC